MTERLGTVCFSGHRIGRLPQTAEGIQSLRKKLYNEIDKAVRNGQYTFLFGGCYGFDLLCAETVLFRKRVIVSRNDSKICLVAVLPFEGQADRWNEKQRDAYFNTLGQCDEVITLHKHYAPDVYHERNRYLADHSGKLVCYYDGGHGGTEYTVSYAQKQGLEIVNLYPNFTLAPVESAVSKPVHV